MSEGADTVTDHGPVPTLHVAAHRSRSAARAASRTRRSTQEQVRSVEHVSDLRNRDAAGARALPLPHVRLPGLLLFLTRVGVTRTEVAAAVSYRFVVGRERGRGPMTSVISGATTASSWRSLLIEGSVRPRS
jgi:hypothetical protein